MNYFLISGIFAKKLLRRTSHLSMGACFSRSGQLLCSAVSTFHRPMIIRLFLSILHFYPLKYYNRDEQCQ
jgi:hypothetical protein